jgi:type IV secretion system VirB5/TraC/TraE/TrbJ family protein
MRNPTKTLAAGLTFAAILAGSTLDTSAQVPVIDTATLSQATTTAANTAAIMNTNQQILTSVTATQAAVTGNRTTGSMTSAALGSGFTMTSAPSLSSIFGGGQMSWGSLGSYGQTAAGIVNGLNLVKTLSGNPSGGTLGGSDAAYLGAVNTAAALAGVVAGAQTAAAARTAALQSSGALIGSAPDIKGSIDQNSQMQVQTALVINELIGVMNGANASLNAQQMQELAGQSTAARIMTYDASKATLVGH